MPLPYCQYVAPSAGSILKAVVKSTCLKPSKLLGVLVAAILLSACSSAPTDAGDGGKGKGKGKGKNGGGGTVPVEVAKVTLKNVPVDISVVGNVEAYSVVTVRAQTGGMLTKVNFQEGDYVKKNDVLFLIDRKPLEGQMKSAMANLQKSTALELQAEANLNRDTANAKYAREQTDRYLKLVEQGIFAKEQGEQLKSNADALAQLLDADEAAINSAKAQMESDQSAINNLNIQLGYTNVYAPMDGRTGNVIAEGRQHHYGQHHGPGDHQPGGAHLRHLFRSRGQASRREAVFGKQQAGGDRPRPGWHRRYRAGRADVSSTMPWTPPRAPSS